MEKIFAEFKEDLIKVGKKVVNNVVDFYPKEVETNVVEQKCPFKDVDKKLLEKMWMTKMLLKKSGQKMVKICNLYFQAEEVMTKRNEELKKENKIPYTVLLPSRIPAGISI